MTSDFLSETMQGRQKWSDIFKILKKNCQPRILYSEKYLSKMKTK